MARYAGAKWRPLPENATQAKIKPTQVILHTAVDHAGPTSLFGFFSNSKVKVESHFFVKFDGVVEQYMDTEVRADANRYANRRADGTGAISIETEDDGDPSKPWSAAQLVSIVALIDWAHDVHDVPLVVAPAPDAPGIGYHSMWGAPSAWTPSRGKTCPGPVRISQFVNELMPVWSERREGVAMSMSKLQAEATVDAAYKAVLHRLPDRPGRNFWVGQLESGALTREAFFWTFLEGASAEVGGLQAEVKSATAAVKALEARVKALEAVPTGVELNPAVDEGKIVAAAVAEVASKLAK